MQVRRKGLPPLTKSFFRKADADAWARKAEADADNGAVIGDRRELEGRSVSDLLNRYLRDVTPLKRSAAFEALLIKQFLREPFSRLSLENLSPQHFSQYRDRLLRTQKPETVRRKFNVLHYLFEVARKEWGLPIQPD